MNTIAMGAPAEVHPASEGSLDSRAKTVAAVAARHAAEVDTQSRFPQEAFGTARAQRLLGILVPATLGGEGASIAQVADVCFRLGQACASTGMIYAMHQVKVACLVRHRHDSASIERVLRRLCAEQLLLASSTTEGQAGGNVRSSEAAAVYQDDRVTLERQATCISYGAAADGIVTTARRSVDASGSDQVLIAFLKEDYTLTQIQTWDTLGMRGTCSIGYVLRGNAPQGQVMPEPYESIHRRTMVPFAHILWGSVWAGVATAAVAKAQAFVRAAARKSGGQMPPGATQLGKAMYTLRTLRATLRDAMRRYQSVMDDPKILDSIEFQSQITLVKVEASELAVAAVLAALRVCGLSGYRSDTEFSLERHVRDILSSPLMINNDRILSSFTTTAMMAPIAGVLSE